MAIPSDNLLDQIKNDAYYRLLGDTFLDEVSILIDDEHDMANRDKVELGPKNVRNSKTGACITVLASNVPSLTSINTPSPLMNIVLTFEILEDVIVNAGDDGTGLTSGMIVARLVQLFHRMHIAERITGLKPSPANPVQEIFDAGVKGRRGHLVFFEAANASFGCVDSVAQVTAVAVSGEVTLTCATSGATIYYTTDGSYPGSGNPNATAYSAPFSPGTVTVRAAAEKADMNASHWIESLDVS